MTFSSPPSKKPYVQEPIAVVGISCRLPGESTSPKALWDFLERGGVAGNDPPKSRFRLDGHHDGSKKPKTMRTAGGMFIETIDPQEFDAGFFGATKTDAIAMDPQQRQLLEVVYEGLENAGISLESLDGQPVGCFVGSYGVDYADMHNRDPEDRPPSVTIGVGRAILSNRLSHFLNIKGPSFTVDTACSGSLIAVDVACRYLNTGEINGAIVAGANLYLSPEHNMDGGAMAGAASLTGKCHTFDVKADGYCKAEAINAVILKRLDDAIKDRDPIRAIIRGCATNSDGKTPGIASPSAEAQATAIRAAYANAGITDYNQTQYLECHGTGTQAGDPIEVDGAARVFGPSRAPDAPLLIGSIKSNVGHSEPAAGINGMLKAILSLENGRIPGNPTFITPNPKINFETSGVRAFRNTIPWPTVPFRRASVNSFGYGGSNAHVVLDEAKTIPSQSKLSHVSSYSTNFDDFFDDDDEEETSRPFTLVFSANDESSLKSYCGAISQHLINPSVNVKLPDLSYTLSERRSKHFHRGYIVTKGTNLDESSFVFGKKNTDAPRVGFVFTGQGAQWPQMGKSIIETFPSAKALLENLDKVLQSLHTPPKWSLIDELTQQRSPEALRQPEFSQPLVTALQLVILGIFDKWGVKAQGVVGHSSGEIAAACAAGFLTPEEAIKVAYYRGQAAINCESKTNESVGMLAVGLGAEDVQKYIGTDNLVQIACYNSPKSVTLSGRVDSLEKVRESLVNDSHFARMLLVNLAYHSSFMADIATEYQDLLVKNCQQPETGKAGVSMFSSVTGGKTDHKCDSDYWKSNMVSAVRFDDAVKEMVSGKEGADFLIEIGPSGALAGPIKQIKAGLGGLGNAVQYFAASTRSSDSVNALFDVAGRLFVAGGSINLDSVNTNESTPAGELPSVIVDLPNYIWNHSAKYWHESESSKDWRFRLFPHHDLIGTKVLGTSWHSPSWKKVLKVESLKWLKDHKMGTDIVFPGAAFISMAIEGLYQSRKGISISENSTFDEKTRYRLRNVTFAKALVFQENSEGARIMLSLNARPGPKDSWYDWRVSSLTDNVWTEHSRGMIRAEENVKQIASKTEIAPLQHTTPGHQWYKSMTDAGYSFGPTFQKHMEAETISGQRQSRSLVDLSEPQEKYQQSFYPMHPVCIDGCFQTVGPSLWSGNRSTVNAVLVPAMIDSLIVSTSTSLNPVGVSVTRSEYVGIGRKDEVRNSKSDCRVYDKETGELLLQLEGLRYSKLETRESPHEAHKYSRVDWKPDVTFLTQENLDCLPVEEHNGKDQAENAVTARINQVVDLVAHKKPKLKVMEVNLTSTDISSTWLDGQSADRSIRSSCSSFRFVLTEASSMMSAQEKYESQGNVEFTISDFSKPPQKGPEKVSDFDLIIVKTTSPITQASLANVARNCHKILTEGGHLLLIEVFSPAVESDSDDSVVIVNSGAQSAAAKNVPAILESHSFCATMNLFANQESPEAALAAAHICRARTRNSRSISSGNSIALVHLSRASDTSANIKAQLCRLGLEVEDHAYPFAELKQSSIVLVVEDLDNPLLATVSGRQWKSIKELTRKENKILWVTSGSQLNVTNPDNALIHGLARTIRAEDPMVSLTTLDVESTSSQETLTAIYRILVALERPILKTNIENEYVERGSTMFIPRIRPDELINQAEKGDTQGAEFAEMDLHDSPTCINLRAERLGTLDSLKFSERCREELPLPDAMIEVEIFAAGVNFKDVAVTMGIVPENEHLPGLEGAGVVRRVGSATTGFHIGQRVAVYEKGTFANRVQLTPERAFPIPHSMSFEEAATMPSVYLVAIYGLYHVANLQKGQSVLIHSASGGVGIAAIQLCKHVGAEIYCTVGTEAKRKFLVDVMGIKPENIFSSRTIAFAAQLMKITNGYGIDVVLNSLTGDLLDESWRIVSDGGQFIEIGKKDVIDRNTLAMEPFNRNCSYRGVDMSHKSISDPLIARLLAELFGLVAAGHCKPIDPMKVFPFEEIIEALRFLRGGNHLGKIVISNGANTKITALVRPAPRTLAIPQDQSCLIVGGLKGLCGSLALYLARVGAKHLTIMSRSGYADDVSQGVLANIYAEGCKVSLVKGDVSVLEDVERTFKEASVPIGGVIQGAMVLRDKIFTSMTVEEFHQTITSKVQGTWNLHNVSVAQPTPLSFFTMLSSISGVVGQKGQANYSAANVFLDNFALYRHSLGLAANSVDLGVIEDVGYVANHQDLKFDRDVWVPINESLLHKVLRFSLLQQSSQPINKASTSQLITGIAIPQLETGPLMRDARFSPLAFGDSASSGGGSGSGDAASKEIATFFLMLNNAASDPTAVLNMAVTIVNRQFTSSLHLNEPMEPAKPLAAYGLDSLAAVEFRNWVRMEIGAELSTLEITNATSLFSLCEKIIVKVKPAASVAT